MEIKTEEGGREFEKSEKKKDFSLGRPSIRSLYRGPTEFSRQPDEGVILM